MNVVPHQIAGVPSAVASLALAREHRRLAGYPHPTILAACAPCSAWTRCSAVGGASKVAAFMYGFEDEGTSCEPVSLVTGPGNIYVTAAKRFLKGLIGIDAEAGTTEIAVPPTTAPTPSTSPPTSSARPSTTCTPPRSWSPTATGSPPTSPRARPSGPADQARRTGPHALGGKQSGSSSSTTSPPASTWSTPTPRSTSRSRPVTPTSWRPGCAQRRRRLVGRTRPVSLGDYAAGSNHVLPTGGCACHSSGLSADLPARHPRRALRRGRPARRRAPRRHPRHGRGPARARRGGHGPLRRRAVSRLSELLRPELARQGPRYAPQLDVPYGYQRELLPGAGDGRPRHHRCGRRGRRGPQPVPDREFTELRAALAVHHHHPGVDVVADEVWAGNGSNEVLQHLLQAFGGPAVALGFTSAYSMHLIITETLGTTWVDGLRGAARTRRSTSPRSRRWRRCASTGPTSSSLLAEQPDRHRPVARGGGGGL